MDLLLFGAADPFSSMFELVCIQATLTMAGFSVFAFTAVCYVISLSFEFA